MKRTVDKMLFATAAATILLVWYGFAFAADEPIKTTKDIIVEDLSRIRSDNPDFKIQIQVLGDRKTFRVGDAIEFRFRTNKVAYVTLVDVGSSGRVHVIFPNKWNRDNKVEANRWYRVPPRRADWAFQVRGPAGVNHLKAIASVDRFDVLGKEFLTSGDDSPFDEIKDAERAIKDIGVRIGKRDRKSWTEASTSFTIRDSREGRDRDIDDDDDDAYRSRERSRTREWRERESSERDNERFVVKLWTDRKSYHKGEPVTFFFYSERDCYLNLLDFGTSGKTKVIFPNRFQKDNFVKGGKVLEIPDVKDDSFRFRTEGPEGTEVVKAIITRHKYQIYRNTYDFEKHVFQPWEEDAEKIESDIQVRLGELPDDYYVRATTKFKVTR
ncbi:MAG: DUF4384 domain-containing protein [Desulfomonile sp.]|nr:DUF4384 domain-containing protein [Desulfomonile sp.]